MDKITEDMTVNHGEVKKKVWAESSMLAVEQCFICQKIFHSKEDLDNHN